jgi:hypothetical protein
MYKYIRELEEVTNRAHMLLLGIKHNILTLIIDQNLFYQQI